MNSYTAAVPRVVAASIMDEIRIGFGYDSMIKDVHPSSISYVQAGILARETQLWHNVYYYLHTHVITI